MDNAPLVKIQYLIDYELSFKGQTSDTSYTTSEMNALSNLANLNDKDSPLNGKKGFHLCGGSYDDVAQKDIGCVMDGTYTFYKSNSMSYDGFMGNCLSDDNYGFSENQYITFKTTNQNTYIKSLFVYFDPIEGEYATKLHFSNAINADGSVNSSYTSSRVMHNNRLVFMYSFGENSRIVQITLNIDKWSKKNALLKILKITTGYTGIYDYSTLNELNWTNNIFSDENEQKYGISINSATITITDKDKLIYELYQRDLIHQNVVAQIYIGNKYQGSFCINGKEGSRGDNLWVFDAIDKFESVKNDVVQVMQQRKNLPLTKVIEHCVRFSSFELDWEDEAKVACDNYIIPTAFIEPQQTIYEVLLKCCQVGLLRMYISYDKLRVVRGL